MMGLSAGPARFLLAALVSLAAMSAGVSHAATPELTIKWSTLLPKLEPLKDPMDVLTQDQRFDIETIIWARGLPENERELEMNRQPVEDAAKYEQQFKRAGVDIEKLLKDYRAWSLEMEKRQQLVNTGLDGKSVKLAGYLLPIEFSEKGQHDFLLLPYVGACVHVPPPPPNQIVYVRLTKKMIVKDLFTPVWIKGVMKTKRSSKALNLSDGNRKIPVGYHIDGAAFEPFKE